MNKRASTPTAKVCGPQEEGEYEYAAYHHSGESGTEEHHIETGVLYQPLGGEATANGTTSSTMPLCEAVAEGPCARLVPDDHSPNVQSECNRTGQIAGAAAADLVAMKGRRSSEISASLIGGIRSVGFAARSLPAKRPTKRLTNDQEAEAVDAWTSGRCSRRPHYMGSYACYAGARDGRACAERKPYRYELHERLGDNPMGWVRSSSPLLSISDLRHISPVSAQTSR
jgi:hypothetical protein